MDGNPGAGWQPDPFGWHQLRYHDGATFTRYVCDNGVVSEDDRPAIGVAPSVVAPAATLPGPSPDTLPTTPWPAPPRPSPYGAVPTPPYGGLAWPGGTPATGGPSRVGLRVAVTIAAVEGVAIVALAIALVATHGTMSSQPIGITVAPSGHFSRTVGSVVYSSTFRGGEGWFTGNLNANTAIALSNGEYVIQGSAKIHHLMLTPYSVANPGISVEAEATDYPVANVSVGVGCQSGSGVEPALVYQLVVYPVGEWYLEEGRVGGSVQTLASGSTAPLTASASVQLTCVITDVTSSAETTQLIGYVNGSQVRAIGDRITAPLVGGYIPILVVGSYGPTVHVAYRGITVKKINPPSVMGR